MRKGLGSDASLRSRSTVFPNDGISKDRLHLQVNSGRGYGSSAALLPLGNRRSVPSKWEDAEKWICSPVSVDGFVAKNPELPAVRRRPKSKSGPLGPHCIGGVEPCLSASLMTPDFDDERAKTFTANSPTLRGVLEEDGGFGHRALLPRVDGLVCWEGQLRFAKSENGGVQRVASVPIPGWSELMTEASSSSLSTSQEGKLHVVLEGETSFLSGTKKDVGTQMSPQGSTCASPISRSQSSSHPTHSLTIGELHKHFSRLEVRDVQVDDQITMQKRYKRHKPRDTEGSSSHGRRCRKKSLESSDSSWEAINAGKNISKEKREARIIAWENLQKAKAEAAIRELEMKLEKKRSSSMDKILNKLSSAQKKAEKMRKSVTAYHAQKNNATSRKAKLFQKINHLHLVNGCFYAHAL